MSKQPLHHMQNSTKALTTYHMLPAQFRHTVFTDTQLYSSTLIQNNSKNMMPSPSNVIWINLFKRTIPYEFPVMRTVNKYFSKLYLVLNAPLHRSSELFRILVLLAKQSPHSLLPLKYGPFILVTSIQLCMVYSPLLNTIRS